MSGTVSRRHGAAALALTILALAALVGLAIAPHVRAKYVQQETTASRAMLATLNRLAERGPELASRNNAIRSEQNKLALLLSGQTTGIAGAELQRFLLKRTARHQGKATTVLVQPPERESGLTRISALLTVRVGITGLRDLLHDLETGLPLLFISELSIRAPGAAASRPAGTLLDVRMRVSGYLPKREVPQS